jgi:hypothetical protein
LSARAEHQAFIAARPSEQGAQEHADIHSHELVLAVDFDGKTDGLSYDIERDASVDKKSRLKVPLG